MNQKSKDFYVWTLSECIKDTYEWWGTDMMSMYDKVKEDFPNAAEAIQNMYTGWNEEDFYAAKHLSFKQVHYVYQAIANLIPLKKVLKFDTITKEQNKKYKRLNICSWNKFVKINRMDLLMAILLFTEEFIFYPITSYKVVLTDTKLTVYGDYVTFKISKREKTTCVSIRVRGVMLLQYIMLN